MENGSFCTQHALTLNLVPTRYKSVSLMRLDSGHEDVRWHMLAGNGPKVNGPMVPRRGIRHKRFNNKIE